MIFRSERPRANRGTQVSDKRSALDALSAAEKAAVLDELLAARPDLRQPAGAYAAQVMAGADRSAVAGDAEDALRGLGIEELDTRAGYQPGRGYVHPAEAADEIQDEALQPFLDDLHRRAGLGMRSAAAELAAGIMLGLYHSRRVPRHRAAGSAQLPGTAPARREGCQIWVRGPGLRFLNQHRGGCAQTLAGIPCPLAGARRNAGCRQEQAGSTPACRRPPFDEHARKEYRRDA
jgi:hypothetical protein